MSHLGFRCKTAHHFKVLAIEFSSRIRDVVIQACRDDPLPVTSSMFEHKRHTAAVPSSAGAVSSPEGRL